MSWKQKIEDYVQGYATATTSPEALEEARAWINRMVRVEKIWEVLRSIWQIFSSDTGWDVYYALEEAHGTVPNPDHLLPEVVKEGLLRTAIRREWSVWVEQKYAEYMEKQQ